MQIKERKTFEEHVIGVESAERFGISNNAVIFDVLRKNMYTDPVAAICREISSNSRDANREANRPDEPIKIKIIEQGDETADAVLGLSGDLMISFCDHGIGISPDRMSNIFLLYGESSKRGDNHQTGGWGLGAKTPFAYSDSFSVITVNEENGVRTKYFYTAALDREMKGTMYKFHSEVTEEETGTTITLPISSKDRYTFEKQCRYFTEYWDVPAELINFHANDDRGNPVTPLPPAMKFTTKEGFNFEVRQFGSKSRLLIDGIPYPSNSFNIPQLDSGQININFDNGVLDIAANREYVKDVPENRDLIGKITTSILGFASAWISDYISNIPTKLDALLRLYLLKKEDFGRDYMMNLPGDQFTLCAMYQIVSKTHSTFDLSKSKSILDFKWRGEDIDTSKRLEFFTLHTEAYDQIFTSRKNNNGNGNFLQTYHYSQRKDGNKTQIFLVDGKETCKRQRFYTLFAEKKNLDPTFSIQNQSVITYRIRFKNAEEYAAYKCGMTTLKMTTFLTELEGIQQLVVPFDPTDQLAENEYNSKLQTLADYNKYVGLFEKNRAEEIEMLNILFDLQVLADVVPTKYDNGVRARRKPDAPVKVQYAYSNFLVDYYKKFTMSCGSRIEMLQPLSAGVQLPMTDCVMFEVASVGGGRRNGYKFGDSIETMMKFIHFISLVTNKGVRVIAAAVSKKAIMELGGAMTPAKFFEGIKASDYKKLREHLYLAFVHPTLVTMSSCPGIDFPEKDRVLEILKPWAKYNKKDDKCFAFKPDLVSKKNGDSYDTLYAIQNMIMNLIDDKNLAVYIGDQFMDIKEEMKDFNSAMNKYPMMDLIDFNPEDKKQMEAVNHYICLVNESIENKTTEEVKVTEPEVTTEPIEVIS